MEARSEAAVFGVVWCYLVLKKCVHHYSSGGRMRDCSTRPCRGSSMSESALQLWHGVLFRQRPDDTFEAISPHVQQWTGLAPECSLNAIHPADRAKTDADRSTFRLRHARTWQITWVEQRRRALPAGGYEGYWEDVTERARLGQELAQAHWRATLGTTTQRLVHDFNN